MATPSAWTVYDPTKLAFGEQKFSLSTGTYNLILCTSSYTPAPTTDATYSNVSTYELATGGGYTVGGEALTGVTWTLSGNTATFTSSAPSWSSFTAGPFQYAIIVNVAAGSGAPVAADLLIAYSDVGSITGGNATFTINMSSTGIFTLS